MANRSSISGNPPSYIALTPELRYQYFDSLIILQPHEFKIIDAVCNMWKPEVAYDTLLNKLDDQIGTYATAEAVFRKLSEVSIGLLVHATRGREVVPDFFVLTEPRDPFFFQNKIYDYYICQKDAKVFDFLRKSPMRTDSRAILFEKSLMDEFSISHFAKDNMIYKAHFDNGPCYFTGRSLLVICQLCLEYLDKVFDGGNNTLSHTAKLNTDAFRYLKGPLNESKAHHLVIVLDKLIPMQARLIGQIRSGGQILAESIFFLKYFCDSVLKETEERQGKIDQLNVLFGGIVNEILGAGDFIDAETYHEYFDNLPSELSDNPERDFNEKYATPLTKKLPEIVKFGNLRIHKKVIPQFFFNNLSVIIKHIHKFYEKEFDDDLVPFQTENIQLFTSYEGLEDNLHVFLNERYKNFAKLLKYPDLVFRGLWEEESERYVDDGDKQNALRQYFRQKNKVLEFKHLAELFQLNFIEDFYAAYGRKTALTKFLLKLTRRYDIVHKKVLDYEKKLEINKM